MSSFFLIINSKEHLIIGPGLATISYGKEFRLPEEEKIRIIILDHPEPGAAATRIEVSDQGHLEASVYYGKLPEGESVGFESHGNVITVLHSLEKR